MLYKKTTLGFKVLARVLTLGPISFGYVKNSARYDVQSAIIYTLQNCFCPLFLLKLYMRREMETVFTHYFGYKR